jgi:hypothetical protein
MESKIQERNAKLAWWIIIVSITCGGLFAPTLEAQTALESQLFGQVTWKPPIVPLSVSLNTKHQLTITPAQGVAIPLGPFGTLELGVGYSLERRFKILTVIIDGDVQKYAIAGEKLEVAVAGNLRDTRISSDESGNVIVRTSRLEQRKDLSSPPQSAQQWYPSPAPSDSACTFREITQFQNCAGIYEWQERFAGPSIDACVSELARSCADWGTRVRSDLKIKLHRLCNSLYAKRDNCVHRKWIDSLNGRTSDQRDCSEIQASIDECQMTLSR